MPNPNAIVSKHIRLELPPERTAADAIRAEGGLSVELDDGRRVRLDPANPRSAGFAQVLDGLAKLKRPVYLEVDPETEAITLLLIPHVARVIGLSASDGGYDVELDLSHARHVLRRDQPDFGEIETGLREALDSENPVVLTEDDAHEILDIRPFRPSPDDDPALLPEFDIRPYRPNPFWYFLCWIWYWPIWPWWWWRRGCISMVQAQQVFDAMSATSCNPLTVPAPCIPFLYPDDGCWGRAHEMCRLMINMGLSPKKVWIKAGPGHFLHTLTRNHPNCFVNWNWHVAPTLCVRQGCLWFWTQQMVIDPSLFTTPVSQATWKSVQGDPTATLTPSAASIFYYWSNSTDPTYTQTNMVLATYRLQLQNRSNSGFGPPPYANCP